MTLRKKPQSDIRVLHLSTLLSVIVTLPIIFIGPHDYTLFLTKGIHHFLMCMVTALSSLYICKFIRDKKAIKATLMSIALLLTIGSTLVAHDAIINLLQTDTSVFDDKTVEWLQKTNLFTNGRPLYKNVMLVSIHTLMFCLLIFYIVMSEKDKELKNTALSEVERLKNDNLETQMLLLKQQISPHFLFNSLNTLRCITQDTKSKNYITQLSNVYRYLLTKKGDKEEYVVKLKDELEFINSYLYILKERFEDAIEIHIDVEEKCLQMSIPPLAIQVLIENAAQHNVVALDSPLKIHVYSEDSRYIVVSNNIQERNTTTEGFGMGLKNIRKRYQLLNNNEIEINKSESEFTVKLPLIEN